MRSIGIIDDFFSVLKNGFMVLDYVLWRHYPFNMLLACIAWLLPVATVITPATLNVCMASFSNATLMRVPRVDFRQFKFATLLDYANTPQFMYETSKPEVQRILVNTAVQGDIMPITPPSINSSWTLEFYGPALKCEHVGDDIHRDITQNVQSAILNISTFGVDDRKDLARVAYTFGYLAWPAGKQRLLQHQLLHHPPNDQNRKYIDSFERRRRQRVGFPSGPSHRHRYISFKDGRGQGQSSGKAVFNVEELEVPLTPQTPESARLLKSPELYEEIGLGLNQRLGTLRWFNGGARRDIRYHEVNQ